jgi:hypothetical protein
MSRMAEYLHERLEYLRGELRAERISYGELAELQDMAWLIPPDDVELLEAAGVPECCAPTWPERCGDHETEDVR